MTTLIPKFDLMNGGSTPTGATNRPINQKLSDTISVKDFGAVGDGVTDDTAALQAARNYLVTATNKAIYFPSGTYLYTSSPNWAIENISLIAEGQVILKYTGTGDCLIFDTGLYGSGNTFNVNMVGNFVILGTATSGNGLFIRSVHRSTFEARIWGCGTSAAGLLSRFTVGNTYKIVVAGDENGGYGSAIPAYGIVLTNREDTGTGATQLTTTANFISPIIEAVSSSGIVINNGTSNNFFGGFSESNGVYGIVDHGTRTCFYGIDCESNTSGDIYCDGTYNSYINCNFTQTATFAATCVNANIIGGQVYSIANSGSLNLIGTSIVGISGTGSTSYSSVYNITAAKYQPDLQILGQTSYLSVPASTPTTVLTLNKQNTKSSIIYQVTCFVQGGANTFCAYALIYQTASGLSIINQTNGTYLSISVSGLDVQVTLTGTGGSPAYIQSNANPI